MEDFFDKYLERLGIEKEFEDDTSNSSEREEEPVPIPKEFMNVSCVYLIRYKKNNKYYYRVGFTENIQLVINNYYDLEIIYLFITNNQNFEIVLKYRLYENNISIEDGDYEINYKIYDLLDGKCEYKNPFYTIDAENVEKYCDTIITNKSTRIHDKTNCLPDLIQDFPNIFS